MTSLKINRKKYFFFSERVLFLNYLMEWIKHACEWKNVFNVIKKINMYWKACGMHFAKFNCAKNKKWCKSEKKENIKE